MVIKFGGNIYIYIRWFGTFRWRCPIGVLAIEIQGLAKKLCRRNRFLSH